MESKKVKQAVGLALDTCGMRGRFTKADVAEEAAKLVKWEDLSSADQRDALIRFIVHEANAQMKAPLRTEIQEEFLKNVPEQAWPVLEKITKTICVSPGGGSPYHVLTLYASAEDWQSFLSVAEVMERKAAGARNTGQDTLNLLKANGVASLYELFTGRPVARQPFPKSVPHKTQAAE